MINKKKLTILVVEDDELDALLIKESLNYTTFKIYQAGVLSEALQFLSQPIPFDAILLDLTLPDSEGIHTFNAVHSTAQNIPIIILTGVDDEETVFNSLQSGAQDYLLKGHVNKQLLDRSIRYAIERKQIELRLKESLDLNQKIFSATAQGILTYKATGKCVFANEAAAQIINATVENLLNQDFHSIESWKNSSLYEIACEVLVTGIPRQQEISLTTTFGREIWVDFYFASFYSLGEAHLLLILNDKTKKQHIEKALEWKNYLMDMLMQNSPDAIYFKDLNGCLTNISKAMVDKLGFEDVKDVIGKTDFDLFSQQHASQAFQDEIKILSSGEGIYNYEEKETYNNKPDTWVITSKMPLFDITGEIIGTFGISRDITDRKIAEDALIKSKTLLDEAMEIAQLYNWVYDVQGEVFIFDEKLWQFIGHDDPTPGTYQLPISEYIQKFVFEDDKGIVINDRKKAQSNTDPDFFSQTEYRIVRLDGTIRHIIVRTRVLMNDAGNAVKYFGILQDITDRKIAIQESYEALNRVDSVKTDFLSFISQEIRAPLNGIVGSVNLIKNQENSSAIRDLLEILDKSVSNLEFFTDNATCFSNLTNNYQLETSSFNLKDLIQFAILENENKLNEKRLRILFKPAISSSIVLADKDLIYRLLVNTLQIFTNISNLNNNIIINIQEEDDKITCSISNNNESFPADLLRNFSSVSGIYHNRQIGLSLSIVKQIMDIHNGSITIFNMEKSGATMKLSFPK